MPDKQNSPQALASHTDQEKVSIQIISQESKFMPLTIADICDADLAVKSGEISYCRQLVKLCDLRFVGRGDSPEAWTQANP